MSMLGVYRGLLEAVYGPERWQETGDLPRLDQRPAELELQSRWFNGEFGRDFVTLDGRMVSVRQFGEWNRSAGPDFREVVVAIGGRQARGALELDWDARDWERHAHAVNPAYDGTVLHVFFADPPAGERFFTRTSAHRDVPQVRIDLTAHEAAQGLTARRAAAARIGRCAFPLARMDKVALDRLFEGAARQRMARKAARFEKIADLHGRDQALFQEVAAGLGYRNNKWPMTALVQRLPLRHLQGRPGESEALLFGVAGFLETKIYETAAEDTRRYLRGLWETWWKHRAEFDGATPLPWAGAGIRPQNHPHRRIAALSLILQHWKSVRTAFDTGSDAVERVLTGLGHPYWSHHYTMASARLARPVAIVGNARVADLLANVFFPARSLKTELWWTTYAILPAPLDNEKSRRAAARLLGHRPDAATFTRRLYQQQALLQIYEDFCLVDDSDCARCQFPTQLQQFR